MATPLRKRQNSYGYAVEPYTPRKAGKGTVVRKNFNRQKIQKPKKQNPLKGLVSLAFLGFIGYCIIPYLFTHYFEPMFFNRINNRAVKINATAFVTPTHNYASNSNFRGTNLIVSSEQVKKATKNKKMSQIAVSGKNYALEGELKALAGKYPQLKPSIFVWDYSSGKSVEINADKPVPTASMIKIPILIELFRQIEASQKRDGKLKINNPVVLDEIYKTSGSGELQYGQFGFKTSLNEMANLMITTSDNTATNLILDQIGGKDGLNRAFREWGVKNSVMGDWLPDLAGQNKMSARDVSTMLYNLDNPTFLGARSKEYIKEYMVNVKNVTLLKAGLGKDATIYHKTGDIGTMLGDAGIVYSENGKKYIVTIMVQRNHNDYSARNFIQEASSLIYKASL